jgi:hypothetical protein
MRSTVRVKEGTVNLLIMYIMLNGLYRTEADCSLYKIFPFKRPITFSPNGNFSVLLTYGRPLSSRMDNGQYP